MANVGYATLQIIPSVRGIADEIRSQLVGPAEDAGGEAGQAAGGSMKEKLLIGAAAAGAAAGAVLVAATVSAVEKERMADRLSAQLGLSGKGAKQAGKVAGNLYSRAVVDSFEDGAAAVRAVMGSGLIPEKATTKTIESITTKVADLASTFDQDLGGAANAATQLIRTGLAKDAPQALDLLTAGLQSSANKADDFLDTINEYGTQFRKAGLDGAGAVGLLNQAIRAGARDADIAADAIKEFSIRAVDGSESSADGFKALGLSADDMAAKFAKGGKSANTVLDLTLDKLRNVKDPVKQSQIAVQLFGTQAEDLGKALFAMDPSAAADGLVKVGGAAKRVGDTIRGNTATELKILQRQLMGALGTVVQSVVLPALRGLITAVQWVGRVISAVVGWFREWGVWLAPLAVLIGGVALALNAQAIATGLVTATFAVYRAVILAGTAVTQGFAAAQALLNSVMALNPITLIVIALVALGAALVVAYHKSETFRGIVMAVWNGIKTAALIAWNTVLKPVLTGIWTALQAVGRVALWLWTNAIGPAFRFIWTAARVLFAVVAVAVLTPLVLAFKVVSAVVMALWKYAIQPVFTAVAAIVKWAWNTVVKPVFGLWLIIFRQVGAVVRWLYDNVVKPVFGRIKTVFTIWWAGTKLIFGAVISFLRGTLGAAFRWLYDKVIKPVWTGIKVVIANVWVFGIKPVFELLKRGVDAVRAGFKAGVTGIGKIWDGLKSVAKRPVQFVVDTVYNNGIRKVWNVVAGLVGLGKLDPVRLARGGGVWGAGTETSDSIPALLSHNEHVWTAKEVRGAGGHGAVETLRAMAARGGLAFAKGGAVIPRFAEGGIVDWLSGAAKKIGSAVLTGAEFLTSPGKAWDKATEFIRDKLKGLSGNKWVQAISQFPIKMLKALKDKVLGAAQGMLGGGSAKGSVGAALSFARSQAGKPYQWGGAGNPSWDCSGFMSGIQKVIQGLSPKGRLWSTFSFQGDAAPAGWKRNLRSPFMIGITNRGVGHTAGTLAGVNVESRGGDGVIVGRRARGYSSSLFQTRYGFAPALKGFALGGMAQIGETAWVGERGPELMQVTNRGTRIWSHRDSLRMAAGMGALPGYAKGTTARARASARKQIPGDLRGFTKSLTGSADAISKAVKALAVDLKVAGGAGRKLAVTAGVTSTKLQALAKQRDSVDARLAEAKTAASDQKKAAADFFGLGNFADAATVADLIEGVRGRQGTARQFQAQIGNLQKRGLNRSLIGQLVALGPDSALAGLVSGASAGQIKQLNALASGGEKLSTGFGRTMADAMFDAGKNSAKGFLTGLQSQEKELQKAMNRLGDSLVSGIKKKLKIRSPSQVTRPIGEEAVNGVVVGMDRTASRVAAAAARVADAAVPTPPMAVAAAAGAAAGRAGLQPGTRLRLVVGGREFDAYLDDRIDENLDEVRRGRRAGSKG